MQRLAFISDDRYISEETRRDVKEAVEENFPDLRLDLLSTTQLSTEMLLDTLHSYKPNTGIITIPGLSLIMKMITTTFSTTYRKL